MLVSTTGAGIASIFCGSPLVAVSGAAPSIGAFSAVTEVAVVVATVDVSVAVDVSKLS